MSTFDEIAEDIRKLQVELEKARTIERVPAVEQVIALITKFEITLEELFPHLKKRSKKQGNPEDNSADKPDKKKRSKLPPKYIDPVSGDTWSGRGPTPKWIGKKENKDKFLISNQESSSETTPI